MTVISAFQVMGSSGFSLPSPKSSTIWIVCEAASDPATGGVAGFSCVGAGHSCRTAKLTPIAKRAAISRVRVVGLDWVSFMLVSRPRHSVCHRLPVLVIGVEDPGSLACHPLEQLLLGPCDLLQTPEVRHVGHADVGEHPDIGGEWPHLLPEQRRGAGALAPAD